LKIVFNWFRKEIRRHFQITKFSNHQITKLTHKFSIKIYRGGVLSTKIYTFTTFKATTSLLLKTT